MAEFDRSRFQGTQIASIKKTQEDAKKSAKTLNTSGGGDYVGFFKIEDGINWLRVAPAHNNEDTPYFPIRTSMLKCKVEKIDTEGNKTGEFEIKNKKVFISTFHSGKDSEGKPLIPKDVIETYITYVIRQAESLHTRGSDDFKKYLNPVNGYRASGKWIGGIKPTTEFVCFGWNKDGELNRASFYEGWMKKMNEISLKESGDDVLALDVFSDPNTGYPLTITKRKNDRGNNEYVIDADRPARGESWETFFKRCNPTDEQLMKLLGTKSLKDSYFNVYSSRDLQLALDGLKRFDDENGYNIFANDEFLDEVEEIAALVPEKIEETSKEEVKGEPAPPAKIDVKADTPKGQEAVSNITPIAMKKFLRTYIEENYGAEHELPNLSGEELKKWYDLAQSNDELPFPISEEIAENEVEDEKEAEVEVEKVEEVVRVEVASAKEPEKQEGVISAADRIAKLRALREKQQGK